MKDKILKIVTVLAILVFLVSAGVLGYYFYGMYQGRKAVDGLREERPGFSMVQTDAETAALLAANARLYEQNNDFAAWLSIPGTAVDYPVMYTPTDVEYYLRRSFDKEYNTHGTPFFGFGSNPKADPQPDNLTIYGHNIQTGDMFADLLKYQEKSYWEEHRYLQLSTLEYVWEYEIIACFFTVLDDSDPNQFRYDHFVYADSSAAFDNFMSRVEEFQYYDTGITPQYGDKLLTLSTCGTSTVSDGRRVVVVARRIGEKPEQLPAVLPEESE